MRWAWMSTSLHAQPKQLRLAQTGERGSENHEPQDRPA